MRARRNDLDFVKEFPLFCRLHVIMSLWSAQAGVSGVDLLLRARKAAVAAAVEIAVAAPPWDGHNSRR